MTFSGLRPAWWIALTGVALVACYAPVIVSLIEQWSTNPLFSYGFAVPIISGYVAWTRFGGLRRLPAVPDRATGLPLIAFSAATYWLGHVGGIMILQGVSLLLTLTGLILILLGRAAVRVLWFPLVYLLLMLPIWDYPASFLQVPSQVLSAKIAVGILHAVGVPAHQQGTEIAVPSGALEVMRECSGVNQLVAVVAMVLPAAYLWLDGFRRLVFVVVSVGIGYFTNGLRISVIAWLIAKGFGDGVTEGPMHIVQGLAISAAGYLAILGLLSLLSRGTTTTRSIDEAADCDSSLSVSKTEPKYIWVEAGVLALLLIAAAATVLLRGAGVLVTGGLQTLPTRIDDWTQDTTTSQSSSRFTGFDNEVLGAYPSETGERRFIAADDELVRTYRSDSGARVRLYIGYYRRQVQGKELTGEAAYALAAVSSGATITIQAESIELSEVVRQDAGTHRGLLYWYDVNGRILPSVRRAKGYTVLDALTRRRTNAAVVAIAWEGTGPQSEVARQKAVEFAQVLVPVLRRRLPS